MSTAPMTELERFEDAIRILCVSDTPPNFESVFGKYKEHYLNFWWTLWQAAKADQAAEIERLRKELKYQDAREGWIGTHADGCWSWGTSHYECALGQIAKLKDGQMTKYVVRGKFLNGVLGGREVGPESNGLLWSLDSMPRPGDVLKTYTGDFEVSDAYPYERKIEARRLFGR